MPSSGHRLDAYSSRAREHWQEAGLARAAHGSDPLRQDTANDGGSPAEARASIRLRRRRRVSGPFTALPALRRDRHRI